MKTRWTLSVARTSALVVLAGLLAAPLSANIEVIYTKIPGHPTAAVPGALALNGNPLASDFRALEDLFLSPDGSMWMVKGRTQAIPDEENILILGSGLSGTMFSQEGQPIPGGAANEIVDFFGSAIGQFNANNDFVYTVRARGGVASVFQKVVVYDGTNHCVVWQMGDLYTGLVDVLANPSGDETIGNSIGSVHITNAGRVGAQDSTILNIHTSKRPAIFYADYMGCQPASPSFHMFQQTNETTVIPLGGGAPVLWKTLTANGFFTSLDGSRWLTRGQIVGPPTTSDDVLAVDGQVVIQEGTPLPGDPSIMVNSIVVAFFGADNQWYARGTTAGGGVWAVREGQLIAKTGSPVTPCGGENWGTAFLALAANGVGDWVLVGSTDNPNAGADNVMVLNGQSVVVREGDSVDIPGWGEAKIGRASGASRFIHICIGERRRD